MRSVVCVPDVTSPEALGGPGVWEGRVVVGSVVVGAAAVVPPVLLLGASSWPVFRRRWKACRGMGLVT